MSDPNKIQIQHIPTSVHGRYLVQEARGSGDGHFPLLVGFHGYGQTAEDAIAMMQQIPGIQHWLCCAIQALHPFYIRESTIGANWMTSQDRMLRIQENIQYINAVVSAIQQKYFMKDTLVYFGFSQGTAMACRAAILGERRPAGLMLLGGDIPPELDSLKRVPHILLGRGNKDRFYANEIWERDVSRIRQQELHVSLCTFDGGHVWHDKYRNAAGNFLQTCLVEPQQW